MEKFLARHNIEIFTDRLADETDPRKRATLLRLLIEEENKLGADKEQLHFLDERIASAERLIHRQRALLSTLRQNSYDGVGQAQQLLNLLTLTKGLFERHRQNIQDELDRRLA